MEHTDTKLDDFYLSRDSPIEKCASVAQKRGYPVFALQNGGECYSGPGAETEYTKFGVSRDCRGKLGGPYANSVFRLIGKFDFENVPTIANTTDSDGSTKQSMSKPNASGTFVVDKAPASDEPTPTNSGVSSSGTGSSTDELSSMQEDFVTMQNGVPKRIHYTAGPIHENVTLKYGISSGKFMDQGRVRTIHECIRMCGRQPDCDLAFMLGVQCFSVGCKSKSLCVTKPAFSAFYNPKITFVTHRKVFEAVSSHKRCQSSFIENDVTLQGGINAGKFTDLGQMTDMRECVQRCCAKSTCDVAFMLEDECYGVSCISNTLCKTRPARNPGRYKPKVAYVYHDGKGLDSAEAINVSKTEGSAMSPTGSPPNDTHVCWDSDVLYNQTLIGGINAGVFTDNGKASTMDLCMQFCCKRKDCDLAFMIEDDCYSVACSSTRSCKTRKARPTQFYPRIAFTHKFREEASKAVSGLVSGDTITPETASSDDAADSGKPSPTTEPTAGMSVKQPIKVHHSCSATPIKYNVTLRMGLHSGLFTKMGRVDSMDDCIELSCKKDKTDVAFMMGQHCYSVQCYSEDLCRTEPVYGTTISGLNLTPAVSFLRNNPGTSGTELAYQDNPREQCLGSSITYNVTLRGGIKAGKFREQTDVRSMRDCVSKCCDESSCDLAFMFGERCYSVTCQSEKLCQAVMAKPTNLQPKISYLSKNYGGDRGISLAETGLDTKQPTCKEDDIARTHIARNKTLAGGLEAGTFKFLGKVKAMKSCMRMCCALRSCDVAYMFDRNCFAISCFSPDLCHVTDFPTSNGDVEISTMVKTVKKEKLPEETHSVIVYIVVGAVLLLAGVAGIVWAVCMFLRRHRLKMRHQQRRDST